MSDDSQLEYFYRAVSADELIAIRQGGGLVLNGTEIFITQDLRWVEDYVRRSKAGRYDYILEIITNQGTIDWIFKVGKRHAGSKPAQRDFAFLPILTKGDFDAVHVKVQNQVVTYGLRTGTINGFNQQIQSIESIRELI